MQGRWDGPLAVILVTGFLAWVPGCTKSAHRPFDCTDGGPGCEHDAGLTGTYCTYAELSGAPIDRGDILFVVDNTGSMAEEQDALSHQIQYMTRELIDPRETGPGAPPPVRDLHLGVVSTDMGTQGYTIMTCDNPIRGDDGVLQNLARLPGCQPTYSASDCTHAECPWLSHSPERPDDGSDPHDPPIWEDFACIASLGTGGCGFEQHLEAALQALTVQTGAGRPNDGFLRTDSLLAVIFVSDEDDCSTSNAEFFDPDDEELGLLNVRCVLNPDELTPVRRYFEGLIDLRPGNEDLIVMAGIVGIPIDGSWNPGDPIEELREMARINPANPNETLPSCDTGMGLAWPPARIAELVTMFEDNGVLASICQSDWAPAFQAITRAIQRRLGGSCLIRESDSPSLERCRLVETLPDDRPCPHPADSLGPDRHRGWHLDLGLDDHGRRECEVLPADHDGDGCPDGPCDCRDQRYAGCLEGWFYELHAPPCVRGRIQLTDPDILGIESTARFECLTERCPER
jgi:hypothetical protein